MKQRIKYFLFALILLMMVLPIIQQQFNYPKVKDLKGSFSQPVKPKFVVDNIFQGTFQDSLNTYTEHHIGYRADLVRLYNQIRYTFFDTMTAQGVIMGKEGYMFEMNYIKALYGLDFVGLEKVKNDVDQTIFVNQWLKKNNKHLLVVLAPGKADFFSEFVPDGYKPDSVGYRNSEVYYNEFRKNGIPVIDGNNLFRNVRDTSTYALFPKCGIHWSYYGLGVVFDSVIKSMEYLRGTDFVDFGIKQITVSEKLRSPDRDLWEGINIFSKPDDYAMPYPEFYFKKAINEAMPSVIVVADSYYWQWYGSGYATSAFGKHDFWYYNKQIIPGDGGQPIDRHNVDLLTRVMDADFILLLQTDANMPRYSFGFIKDLYDAIQSAQDFDEVALAEIQATINRISKSPSYMELITEKASRRNISAEEMLRIDATWIYNQKKTKEH